MSGLLSVLSVGRGHLEISFDKANPDEIAKAKKIIQDMIKRGYTIVIEDEAGVVHKVKKFDPDKEVYYVDETPKTPPGQRKVTTRGAYGMRKSKATGIGRTGGG